jgi:hypothetical protein
MTCYSATFSHMQTVLHDQNTGACSYSSACLLV